MTPRVLLIGQKKTADGGTTLTYKIVQFCVDPKNVNPNSHYYNYNNYLLKVSMFVHYWSWWWWLDYSCNEEFCYSIKLMADVVAHQQRNLTWVYIYLDFNSLKKKTAKPIDRGRVLNITPKKRNKVHFSDQTTSAETTPTTTATTATTTTSTDDVLSKSFTSYSQIWLPVIVILKANFVLRF